MVMPTVLPQHHKAAPCSCAGLWDEGPLSSSCSVSGAFTLLSQSSGPTQPRAALHRAEQSRAASNSSSTGLGALHCFHFPKPALCCALLAHSHAPARNSSKDFFVCLFVFYFKIKRKAIAKQKGPFWGYILQ